MGRRGGGWLFEGGKYASLYDVLAFFLAACCCWGDMIWLTCTFFNSLTLFFFLFFVFFGSLLPSRLESSCQKKNVLIPNPLFLFSLHLPLDTDTYIHEDTDT